MSSVDKTISELTVANPLTGSELFPVTQNGQTRRSSITGIITHVKNQLTTDNISEGEDNLYFRNDRADARVNLHAVRTDNPHNVTKEQLGLADLVNIKDNLTAITNPSNNDDTSAGYSIGSRWLNTNTGKFYICVSATNGAAVWTLLNASVKADVGLGNVENTALSTWAGTSNITTVGQSAVIAHEAAINHNALTNADSDRHINHTSVNIATPASGGLSGGGSIAASRSIIMDMSGVGAITGFDGLVDKLPVWDVSSNVIKTVLPSQIAAMSAVRDVEVLTGDRTISASDRGTLFIVDTDGITITFDAITTLDLGFFVSIACPKTSITYTVSSDAADNINGLAFQKFGKQDGFLVIADNIHTLHTVGDKPELIILEHQETSGTAGGTFTAGSFVTRKLTNTVKDSAGLSNLNTGTSEFTLLPGTYLLGGWAAGCQVGNHRLRLYNVTDSVEVILGSSSHSYPGPSSQTQALIDGELVVLGTSAKNYRFEHRCSTTVSTSGFGTQSGMGVERYAQFRLHRTSGITI